MSENKNIPNDPNEIFKKLQEGELDGSLQDLLENFPAMKNMDAAKEFMEKQQETGNDDNNPFSLINVKYYNSSEELPDPKYEYEADSGFDLRNAQEDFSIEPLERKVVSTGLYFSLQDGMELQIRPKSGLAARKGVTVLNAPGTIDPNYRGEVCVILVNLSKETVDIEYGDKIAQGVLSNVTTGKFVDLNSTNKDEFFQEETDRGKKGFGSTGEK